MMRVFNKADFAAMSAVGQFNLGFIIARLRGDLFIVDQHAAGRYRGVCAGWCGEGWRGSKREGVEGAWCVCFVVGCRLQSLCLTRRRCTRPRPTLCVALCLLHALCVLCVLCAPPPSLPVLQMRSPHLSG